ncbi:N-acetyltransferase [Gymnodinialimonas sp. 2305UL16-5]|uniref:GNAT family N-acetyltransferase n=1 Tax=Gymnodinialimonas mytili TaxID=3126503 RepID=UPI0030AC0940
MITIRPAHSLDARQMAELLSEIIAIGGTTALTGEVTVETVKTWLAAACDRSVWHVAEAESGDIVGFQWIKPQPDLPPDVADIATFAKPGQQGMGIGSRLFDATCAAAKQLGYTWINANIRADNIGGLAYYQSRGFEDYGAIKAYPMGDGQIVDKVLKRFDL